jgi:hypothetical protein
MAVVNAHGDQPLLTVKVTSGASLTKEAFCTAAGGFPSAHATGLGVCRFDAASGTVADVIVLGIAVCLVGTGGVTAGDQCEIIDSTGAVTTRTGSYVVVGIALDTASAGQTTRLLVHAY